MRIVLAIALLFAFALPQTAAAQDSESPDVGTTAAERKPSDTAGELAPIDKHLADIEKQQDRLAAVERDAQNATGDDKDILESDVVVRRAELRATLKKLVDELVELRKKTDDADPDRTRRIEKLIAANARSLQKERRETERSLKSLQLRRDKSTDPTEKQALAEQAARTRAQIVELLQAELDNVESARALGLEQYARTDALDDALGEQARTVAALIEAHIREREEASTRPAVTDEDKAAVLKEVAIIDERIDRDAETLESLVTLMKERDLETAEYQRLIIEATGRVTTDIFDADVSAGLVEKWWDSGEEWLTEHAPQAAFRVLLFILIMLAAWVAAVVLRSFVRRSLKRREMSQLGKDFFVSLTSKVVFVVGLVTALSQLGIELGPVLAGLGIVGFIVGFALQDTLGNFASGLMILLYQPYDVDDLIEVTGNLGVVRRMNLVSTEIVTLDNQKLIIPNNKIWKDVIRNVTAEPIRRVDMMFGIGYDDDIDQAREILEEIVHGEELSLEDHPPTVQVHELGDSSVNFVVRVWCNTPDYWDVYWAVTTAVKQRFDAEGVSIPYPQRDVHMHQVKAA